MPVYRIEATVAVTFYVKAVKESGAVLKARDFIGREPPDVSSLPYADPELPEISISPAMTVQSVDDLAEEVE
jgi:hypothetical protein